MISHRRPSGPILRFAQDERGVVTVQNLFFTLAICAVGAIALDVTHFYAARSQLQVAADLAAHAALYTARYGDRDDTTGALLPISTTSDVAAKDAAIDAAEWGIEIDEPDPVVGRTDIVLGTYNYKFNRLDFAADPDPDAGGAYSPAHVDTAMVTTHRDDANAVQSYLFRLLGYDAMDVSTVAIFRLAPGECGRDQGYFSNAHVAINSNGEFHNGFCIAAPWFTISQGNTFNSGTTVLVPNCDKLWPQGCAAVPDNDGLEDALIPQTTQFDDVIDRINALDSSLLTHFEDHAYAYDLLGENAWASVLNDTPYYPVDADEDGQPDSAEPLRNRDLLAPTPLPSRNPDPTLLLENVIYKHTCSAGEFITLAPSAASPTSAFDNFALLTNCQIVFQGGPTIKDVLISTTYDYESPGGGTPGGGNTNRPPVMRTEGSKSSFYASSSGGGPILGADDDCDPRDNVALITRGDYNVAAGSDYYGVHVAAGETVDFQSNAYSEGILIVADGTINNTSNGEMLTCGSQSDAPPRDLTLRLWR